MFKKRKYKNAPQQNPDFKQTPTINKIIEQTKTILNNTTPIKTTPIKSRVPAIYNLFPSIW